MNLPPRFRPMLAAKRPAHVKFPLFVSPKLDGIRCILCGGRAYTRSLKRIPNKYIRNELEKFSAHHPDFLFDGELISGLTFQSTTSAVMSEEGESPFNFIAFDMVRADNWLEHFEARQQWLLRFSEELVKTSTYPVWFRYMIQAKADDEEGLESLVAYYAGEGVICRSLNGPYKFGRATPREGFMWKIKHWADSEAVVVGVTELMHNTNPAGVSELGLTERSSAQGGQYPSGAMGTLVCRGLRLPFKDVVFEIGTGFTAAQREEFWPTSKVSGRIVKFKYQDFGIKDKPRSPVFLGFRSPLDL